MTGLVPAAGTVRRLRALVALGWPPAVLRARSGLAVEALLCAEGALVAPDIAARAHALFEPLSMAIGPDAALREWARAERWLPPLAWTHVDIDDPRARGSRTARRAA